MRGRDVVGERAVGEVGAAEVVEVAVLAEGDVVVGVLGEGGGGAEEVDEPRGDAEVLDDFEGVFFGWGGRLVCGRDGICGSNG